MRLAGRRVGAQVSKSKSKSKSKSEQGTTPIPGVRIRPLRPRRNRGTIPLCDRFPRSPDPDPERRSFWSQADL